MLPLILIVLGLAVVLVGSVSDLRWREVPDWSNYFGIAAALLIRAGYSATTQSWSWIIEGLVGLGAMYCLACGLFYLGQWGGGDSKLLMALGSIFGLGWNQGGLLGGFLINLVLFGGIWGGFWSVKLALEHRSAVAGAYHCLMRKKAVLHAKTYCFLGAALLLAGAFLLPSLASRLPVIILAVTAVITFYSWSFAKSVEKVCFIKEVPVGKLEEGDWIHHDIFFKGKRMCGPSDLGVSRRQINALKRTPIPSVTVKEGVPFVPGFFLAYIATVFWGNTFLWIASISAG